jgi:hypothetical protein
MSPDTLALTRELAGSLRDHSIPAPTDGVYRATPMSTYHRWDAVSNSRLSRIARSPAHLKAYLEEPSEDTLALKIGRAIHVAILEPDDFTRQYATAEKCTASKKSGERCSNNGIAYFAADGWRCGVHPGSGPFDLSRVPLSPKDYAVCMGARDAVHAHQSARHIVERLTEREMSLVWTDPETGEKVKARFDGYAPDVDDGVVIDVKSTEDAREWAFAKSIHTYGYHRQGAIYLDGAAAHRLPVRHYVIIAIEKDRPNALIVYRLTPGSIEQWQLEVRSHMRRYAECRRRNEWPAYTEDVQDISIPDYAFKQPEGRPARASFNDLEERAKATFGHNYDGDLS